MEATLIQTLPVTLSTSAILQLQKLQGQETIKTLRIGVKGGGCSGMTYVLSFDTATEFDEHYVFENLDIIMDKRHLLYLMNMHIDFQDGLNSRGFTFQNPNATSTCGCGTSFGV